MPPLVNAFTGSWRRMVTSCDPFHHDDVLALPEHPEPCTFEGTNRPLVRNTWNLRHRSGRNLDLADLLARDQLDLRRLDRRADVLQRLRLGLALGPAAG